jgi:hypothetical protein
MTLEPYYLSCIVDEPLIASMSLGMLDSMAIALFVMKRMRKQKTCVNSDRKNIMSINFRFWCKVARNGLDNLDTWSLLHSRSRNLNEDERIELPF